MPTLCGRPTKNGTPCKLPLRGCKCPTHDADLSARNRKVAQSFQARRPADFAQQRSSAGKIGYQATGARHGWEKANEKARVWRVEHPSGPEQSVIAILEAANLSYQREVVLSDGTGRSIDFLFGGFRALEVCGHQFKPSFGESEPRHAKHEKKVADLVALGYVVMVIEVAGPLTDDQTADILSFAQGAVMSVLADIRQGELVR